MRRLGWLNVPLWLTYAFLYTPILVLVVMSFNASKTPYTWTGFSFKWYGGWSQQHQCCSYYRHRCRPIDACGHIRQ